MVQILFTLILIFGLVYCQREGEPCADNYNVAGRCVPASQCRSSNNLIKAGIQPKFCEYNAFGNSIVCCTDNSNILQVSYPNMKDDRPVWGVVEDKKRVSQRKCVEYSKNVIEKVDYIALLPDPEPLSISSSKCEYAGVELIVGGENAKQGEFPHMAAIGWSSPDGGYAFGCGGTLISSKFVLTAAHCTKAARGAEPIVVRLGDQNIDPAVGDNANPIDIPIRNMYTHPDYNSPVVYNDIALLELATDIDFMPNIRPACLWSRNDFGGYKKAVATGWGVKDLITLESSKELQKVSLSLLENNYCDELLIDSRNRNWRNGFIPSQMCAGELRGGKDTCQGDSGSPLQVSSNDNHCIYHIVGVTSFGKSCAKSGLPAVYTRVSSYLDWIESVVWPNE